MEQHPNFGTTPHGAESGKSPFYLRYYVRTVEHGVVVKATQDRRDNSNSVATTPDSGDEDPEADHASGGICAAPTPQSAPHTPTPARHGLGNQPDLSSDWLASVRPMRCCTECGRDVGTVHEESGRSTLFGGAVA